MKTLVPFCLIFTFFFHGAHAVTINVTNNCGYTVWAAAAATATAGGGNKPQLSTTGFELRTKASRSLDVPSSFIGRFWGRTDCSNSTGKFTCATGDCGSGQVSCNGLKEKPPASLVELSLSSAGSQDFYDVSLANGFNLPLSISPRRGASGEDKCVAASCAGNVNSVCPDDLAVKGENGKTVIGCKSACQEFEQQEYCCTGYFDSPDVCKPTKYSKIFKNQCPQAYTYPLDDSSSTFSCNSGGNYDITFCP